MADSDSLLSSLLGIVATICYALIFMGFLLKSAAWITTQQDGREPPLLQPSIPFIGHLLGMIRHQSTFLTSLVQHRMPIATLPILNGKIYAIFDASLIRAAQSNKDLSFVPFVEEFVRGELGFAAGIERILKEKEVVPKVFPANRTGTAPHFIHSMNVSALKYVTEELSRIRTDEDLVISNVYYWVRDLLTVATCEALYGQKNPIRQDRGLINDLWLFDLFPTITAPKAYLARGRLQTALGEYYSELGDRDKEAAGITNHRAEVLRENSIKGATVGDLELSFLHVATSNTIPTLFWFFSFIATRPELVSRLRDEALAMVDYGSGESIVIKVHEIAGKCPLLVSCYRETIRLTNKTQSNRRVMTDTKLEDDKGNSFLLKEGVNVQMPSGHLHAMEEIWGPDAAQFNPQRFFEFNKDSTKRNLKARRMSYIPFGGGKHLCPGRHFAFAENLGFMITLLLGFDVLPINADWSVFKEPEQEKCSLAAAVCKPKDGGRGFGMRLKKRAGWESAQWMYVSKTI